MRTEVESALFAQGNTENNNKKSAVQHGSARNLKFKWMSTLRPILFFFCFLNVFTVYDVRNVSIFQILRFSILNFLQSFSVRQSVETFHLYQTLFPVSLFPI